MALSALGVLKALEMYDITAYETLCRKVIVGNEDFIHKGEMGYYSYTGYWNGDVPKNDFQGDFSQSGHYFVWRAIWQKYYPNHPNKVTG